jgi:hypothetical protein
MSKEYYILLMYLAIPLTLVVGAVIMAVNNIDDWGWLIFAALICIPSCKVGKRKKNDKEIKNEQHTNNDG